MTPSLSRRDGPAIETHELTKRYGATTALAGLSMSVQHGEVFGFLGPNGAGKTTAIKLLLGLARPTGGSATLLGAPIGDRTTRRRVGYLPELFRYQPWLRAAEVLRLHCELARLPRPTWPDEIAAALRTVGLAERANDPVSQFSKGMQQRLGLGVALLGRPDIVFLDEPTSALDPMGRVDVRNVILEARAAGLTIFLNSHLLTEVEKVCDRVAFVDRGRVVSAGRLEDVLGEPAVRLRVSDLDGAAEAALGAFGPVAHEGEWLVIRPLAAERVPDVVEAVVRHGGRVHAVDPGRGSLEERFVALMRPSDDRAGDEDGRGPA